MATLHWEGEEYELVEPDDFVLGEMAACEKWHGCGVDEWPMAMASLSMMWITLKRRKAQFPRSRLEALPASKLKTLIPAFYEDEEDAGDSPAEGSEPADPTGPTAVVT